jgi:MGT family glycosyltransferase
VVDVFEQYRRADCELVLTSRAFDFAIEEPEMPDNVLHVGPQLSLGPQSHLSDGRSERRERPLVLASLSTTYQGQEEALGRIVQALSMLPVDGLVTTGPAVSLPRPLPSNVEVSAWVPHSEVLPHTALVLTHGGLGTVMASLAHGVPIICMPMGRDQDGNSARVARLGAGLELARDATPEQIADAIQTALRSPGLRHGAERIAAEIRHDIEADRAVRELEWVANASRRPSRQVR